MANLVMNRTDKLIMDDDYGKDTYLTQDNENRVKLILNDDLKLSVKPDGRVGIGLLNPSDGRLHIKQGGGSEDNGLALENPSGERSLRLWVDANNCSRINSGADGNGPLILNSGAGYVGIGTTSPENLLSIFKSTGTGDPAITLRTGDANRFTLGIDDSDGGKFKISDSGTLGSYDIFVINPENGSVGIGTTNPTEKLHVDGNILQTDGDYLATDQIRAIDGDGLKLYDDSNNGIFIEDGGNVGIGMTNPTKKLEVAGNIGLTVDDVGYIGTTDNHDLVLTTNETERMRITNDGKVRIGNALVPTARLHIQLLDEPATKGLLVTGGVEQSANLLEVQNFEPSTLFVVNPTGNVGIGIDNPTSKLQVAGDIGLTAGMDANIGTINNYALILKTADAERVKINTNGDVGIGTSNPVDKLQVAGSIRIVGTNAMLHIRNENGTTDPKISFFKSVHCDWHIKTNNNDLIFRDDWQGAGDVLILEHSSGNVGIGNLNPGYKLDVNGDVNLVAGSVYRIGGIVLNFSTCETKQVC